MVEPNLADFLPQENPIAKPFRLCVEKLGQSRKIVHPLDLRAMRMAIEFTYRKVRAAPNLPQALRRSARLWRGLAGVDIVPRLAGFGSVRILLRPWVEIPEKVRR